MTVLQLMQQRMHKKLTSIPTSVHRRTLCNLRFVSDIDLLEGSEEHQQLAERLEKLLRFRSKFESANSNIFRVTHFSETSGKREYIGLCQQLSEKKNPYWCLVACNQSVSVGSPAGDPTETLWRLIGQAIVNSMTR